MLVPSQTTRRLNPERAALLAGLLAVALVAPGPVAAADVAGNKQTPETAVAQDAKPIPPAAIDGARMPPVKPPPGKSNSRKPIGAGADQMPPAGGLPKKVRIPPRPRWDAIDPQAAQAARPVVEPIPPKEGQVAPPDAAAR